MSYSYSKPPHGVSTVDKSDIMARAAEAYREWKYQNPYASTEEKRQVRGFLVKEEWAKFKKNRPFRYQPIPVWNEKRQKWINQVPRDDASRVGRVKDHCSIPTDEFMDTCTSDCATRCAVKQNKRSRACKKSGWEVGTPDVPNYLEQQAAQRLERMRETMGRRPTKQQAATRIQRAYRASKGLGIVQHPPFALEREMFERNPVAQYVYRRVPVDLDQTYLMEER